jgi:hypothetical protein
LIPMESDVDVICLLRVPCRPVVHIVDFQLMEAGMEMSVCAC